MKFVLEFNDLDDLKKAEACLAHLAGRLTPAVPGDLHSGLAQEFTPTASIATVSEPVAPASVPNPVPAVPVSAPVSGAPASAPVPAVPVPVPVVPTTTPSYTLDDLARAAMTLMDSGRQEELVGLLAGFGVETLPALPTEKYGAFATALREMGASI